jgi:hypothetical protein
MKKFLTLQLGVVALVACVFAGSAQAQPNISLPPTFGSVELKAGFLPDPYVKNLVAGGGNRTNLGGVNAYVATAPDFKLFYTNGNFALTIYAESQADTTLLDNLPNGTWVANDDTNGLNPQLRFAQPMSGRYDIYVGTFGPNTAPAVLKITELK